MKTFGGYLLLGILILVVYSNSFSGPFVLDDHLWIVENPHIRSLLPLHKAAGFLTKEYSSDRFGTLGRPLVHLSLALNYAISGRQVWSYHAFNLLLHLANAWVLYAILLHIFAMFPETLGRRARILACGCSLIWALHPLQTMAVNYIWQRSESMVSLFFLLTFSCGIRSRTAFALVFFLLGIGSKEGIIMAPLIVFFFQYGFSSRSVREVFASSRGLFVGFAVGWGLLAWQVFAFGKSPPLMGVSPVEYVLQQSRVLGHYVQLLFCPDRLCFDYLGWPLAGKQAVVLQTALVMALIGLFLGLWLKKHPLGFAGLTFFCLLAPTSLVPMPDFVCEYRFYLPSAILLAVAFALLFFAADAVKKKLPGYGRMFLPLGVGGMVVLVVVLGGMTYARNLTYQDSLSLWRDTRLKAPWNWRAAGELGMALKVGGKLQESVQAFEDSLAINPSYVPAHNNLGELYSQLGNSGKAFFHLREAIRLDPDLPKAYVNLGIACLRVRDSVRALENFEKAVSLKPDYADAWFDLGVFYETSANDPVRALENYRQALRFDPEDREAGKRVDGLLSRFPALKKNP
jgi:tetratricopeptide (TPR) repeat protein